MKISPMTPLFFPDTIHKSDGIESRYMQTFAATDVIKMQIVCDANEATPIVRLDGVQQTLSVTVLGTRNVYYKDFTPGVGIHTISVAGMVAEPFRVTNDERELATTKLIQYSNKDNGRRDDTAFIINGQRVFFEFRVPGGFKDSRISLSADVEQFATQTGDLATLYAIDTVQRSLTVGNNMGVPAVYGIMLNKLLTCNYIYIDGKRYERKDGAVPEMTAIIDGIDSFVINILLQQNEHLLPNLIDAKNEPIE